MHLPPDFQSLQTLEINDQNNRSLFLSMGFFDLRLYTVSCYRRVRIRSPAVRLNHATTTKLRDCMTVINNNVFIAEA